jgi:hypothetical protein
LGPLGPPQPHKPARGRPATGPAHDRPTQQSPTKRIGQQISLSAHLTHYFAKVNAIHPRRNS